MTSIHTKETKKHCTATEAEIQPNCCCSHSTLWQATSSLRRNTAMVYWQQPHTTNTWL